jgi:hypothetical protein
MKTIGRRIRDIFGFSCGSLDGSHYMRKPCVLVPGHSGECQSDWELSETKQLRYCWRFDFTNNITLISRTEVSE